jgi:thiol:disulfide interchange protein DsbA
MAENGHNPGLNLFTRIVMRLLRLVLAAACLLASTAFASPVDPKNGAEYVTLTPPQPSQTAGNKVEVLEFFMYHCPHCNALEPDLEAWIKKNSDHIIMRRVHFPYSGAVDPEAHLYLTLEAMGKVDEMHAKVFNAIHVNHVRMQQDEAVIDWASKNGLDKAKFLEYWNSFGVLTKLKRLPAIVAAYKVDGAPTFVVDGRYVTAPSTVAAVNPGLSGAALAKASFQTLDALIAKVQKEQAASKK